MKKRIVEWLASTKKNLVSLPDDIKDEIGYALYCAQQGEQHEDTKVLKGFGGADVIEIIVDDRVGTYRVVYTIQFSEAVFVSHVFKRNRKVELQCLKGIENL
jgi:phage-related protein